MTAVTTAHQVSASAQTPQVTPAAAAAAPPAQHSYGTRIRQNSVIKPSARLRQSDPDPPAPPRRIKPQPMPKLNTMHSTLPTTHDMPAFPPSHINLHPEDANSKVLLAIARSFLSVVSSISYCKYPYRLIPTPLSSPFFPSLSRTIER